MSAAIIADLEQACRMVMMPDSSMSKDQRQLAESVIMNFRQTPSPYELCREILEKSTVDLLLFETADTLKRSVVAEWHQLAEADRLMLRQYLLGYCIERDIPSYVRSKLLQVVAIMIKRTAIGDCGVERTQFMHDIEQMFEQGSHRQQYLASRIVHTLLQEYLTTFKSDDTGLTFEVHLRAKRQFELTELRRVFAIVFDATARFLPHMQTDNGDHVTLLAEFLAIFEVILLWGYISPLLTKRLINALEMSRADQNPTLRLGSPWARIVLDPKTLDVFFALYWKVRPVAQLQHRALTCIVQLATVNGPVFDGPEGAGNRVAYLTNYLTHFLQLLGQRTPEPVEAHSVAMVFRRILSLTTSSRWQQMPEDVVASMVQTMFSVTCSYMELAVAEERQCCDDRRYRPALDAILEAWLLVLQHLHMLAADTIKQYSVQMFNKYLQCRLSWAAINGAGTQTDPSGRPASDNDDDPADPDDEQTDNVRYEEQLVIIGSLGRENLACTLPTMCGLLEERTNTLRDQLLRIYTAQTVQPDDAAVLEPIYDDIQWLTMIAAHLLAIMSEEALIPREVRRFSAERMESGQTDVEATLKLLAAPGQTLLDIDNAEQGADLVVRLVAAVFRLCELENKAIELKMTAILSPEVTRSIVWFVQMWSNSYLLEPYGEPADDGGTAKAKANARSVLGAGAGGGGGGLAAGGGDTGEAAQPASSTGGEAYSVALREAFGSGTAGGKWTVDFLLNKICVNVRNFPGERRVVETSFDIFVQCAARTTKGPFIFQSELFPKIIELRHLDVPKAAMLRGLTLIAVHVNPEEMRMHYLSGILLPISESFQKLEWQQAMSSASEHGKSTVSTRVVQLLDEIRACCAGASMPIANTMYELFVPILQKLADVLDLFHNYEAVVVAIVELLCTVVEQLRGAETRLNEICIGVVQQYVRHNGNRVALLRDAAEEDNLQDLLLLLKLAKRFLNVVMFDLVTDNDNDGEEVCTTILQYILPMITLDMLKYPHFCVEFYTTLCLFVDKSLMRADDTFTASIVQCVTMGLHAFGSEIQWLCLDLLNGVATNAYYDQNPQSFMYGALKPVLQLLFGMIIAHDIDTDNLNDACKALFTLLCVYRSQYDDIKESVVQAYADRTKADALRAELGELASTEVLFNNRAGHLMFGKRFEKFMANLATF